MAQRSATLLASALLAGTMLCVPARAQEPDIDAFMAKLREALAVSDATIDYGQARIEGDTIVLTDVSFTTMGGDPITLDRINFKGPEKTEDGGYRIEEMNVPQVDFKEDDVAISFEDFAIAGLILPADPAPEVQSVETMVTYDQASAGPIAVSVAGEETMTVAAVSIDVSPKPDDGGLDVMVRAKEISADLSAVEDPRLQDALESMGYKRLEGSMRLSAGWNTETGEVDLSDYSLSVDDAGTLAFSFNISGYTPEFIQTLRETRERAATGGPNEATGLAMMGLLQQLTFHAASMSFEDDGLTQRALAYAGESQGGLSGDQMAKAITGMLPLFTGRLDSLALEQQISEAVGQFLDDPQSFVVRAEPETPISFTAIIGAAAASPATLPDILDVEIVANE